MCVCTMPCPCLCNMLEIPALRGMPEKPGTQSITDLYGCMRISLAMSEQSNKYVLFQFFECIRPEWCLLSKLLGTCIYLPLLMLWKPLHNDIFKNFLWIWKINKKFNNLNFLENLISLFFISINSLKKYSLKNLS